MHMYRKSAYLFIVNMVNRSLNFVLRVMLRAILGATDYGMLAVILPVQNLILTVTSYAVSPSVSKHVSEDEASGRGLGLYPFAFILLGIALFAIGFVASPALASFLSDDFGQEIVAPLRMLFLVIPAGVLFSIFTGMFFGRQRARPVAYALFIVQASTLAAAYALGVERGIMGAASAFLVGYIIGIAYMALHFRTISCTTEFDGRRAAEMARFSLPLVSTSLAIVTIFQIDIVVLGRYYTTAETSLYGLVTPTARLIPSLSIALATMLLPKVSELRAKGVCHAETVSRAFEVGLVASLPFTICIFSFAPEILYVLFDSSEATDALRVLSIGMLCYALYYLASSSLQGAGDPRPPMYIIIASALLDVVLCFLLIPPYGITGAAIATSASMAVSFVLIFSYLRPSIRPRLSLVLTAIPLLAFERFVGTVGGKAPTLAVYALVGGCYLVAYVKYAGLINIVRDE
jgi:stage V sporulation protein B